MTTAEIDVRTQIQEINELEHQITEAEDEATDALLWRQAERVVAMLESGMTQRAVAAQWINTRTGKPYDQKHVCFVARVVEEYTPQKVRFRTAYWRVANPAPHGTLSQSNEWYTPNKYIVAARTVLGAIDLDPASCATANRIVRAKEYYDSQHDGLKREWHGRVWMNPPWGDNPPLFVGKLLDEFNAGRVTAAIALLNAHSTDSDWFQPLWAYILCFTDHRIDYDSPNDKKSSSTHGSVFVYLGPDEERFAKEFAQFGAVVRRVA